jgi:hypothetical protein
VVLAGSNKRKNVPFMYKNGWVFPQEINFVSILAELA